MPPEAGYRAASCAELVAFAKCDDRGGTQPEQQARTGGFGRGREDDEDTRADHGAEPDQHRVEETEAAQQLGRHGRRR